MAVAPKVSDFMNQLARDLVEKKGVAESSATAYIRTLYLLNNKAPFKTLAFLRDTEEVLKRVATYAASTQKSILAAIVSVLSLVADKPTYKKTYKYYHEQMMGKARETEGNPNEKTEKQKENWLSWKEIGEKQRDMRAKVADFANKKIITAAEYDQLLQSVVLSLYVNIQPRRNQDYLNMVIVKKWKDDMPTDRNYFDVAGSRFVFNKYKTAKKYGTQTIEIPNTAEAPLMDTLQTYLKFQPLWKTAKGKGEVPFLVTADGKALTAVNAITRLLNRIFGKRVGSSKLRHIFLSDKYDIDEMAADAAAMGHSLEEQRKYLRGDGVAANEIIGHDGVVFIS